MKIRKTRLDKYSEELRQWFGAERLTLMSAQGRLAERGERVSLNCLGRWWEREQRRVMQENILQRIVTGAQLTDQVETQFAKHDAPGLGTLIKLLRVLVMQCSVGGAMEQGMLKHVVALMGNLLEHTKIEQREREVSLAEAKYRRSTCELFLKWSEDREAKRIAGSGVTNMEKIEALGNLMFGEDWGKADRTGNAGGSGDIAARGGSGVWGM